jgi:GTPase KRas protein
MTERLQEYKFMYLGDNGVGKSASCIQFTRGLFVEDYDPTIEDTYRKVMDSVIVDLLDLIPSCFEYTAMADACIKKAKGFFVLYSICSRHSFDGALVHLERVLRIKKCDEFPVVVCGNKLDLGETSREVTTEEGRALADRFGAEFFETSAKSAENLEKSVKTLLDMVRVYQQCRGVSLSNVRKCVRTTLAWCLDERGIPRELVQQICNDVRVGWEDVALMRINGGLVSHEEGRGKRKKCICM